MKSRRISRVGIVGAGQLGKMLGLAGYPLNLRCVFLDRNADAPAAQIAPLILGDLEDPRKLKELALRSEVLSFDWENVPAAALAEIRRLVPIRPPARSLAIAQDRMREKLLFRKLRIPVTPHAQVDSFKDLQRACARLGTHGILKTRRLGYDGKGQVQIRTLEQQRVAWERLRGAPLIYEKFMAFSHEISLVGVRSVSGDMAFYPLARNTHKNGILRFTVAPYSNRSLERSARSYLQKLLESLNYVGVLTIEFFVVNGKLVANEMAPRVHNSGHWTIEGCITSQFENHLRAICGLPLGATRALGHAAMINFIGELPDRGQLLQIEGLAYHDYGKQPRPGRKLGHCTIVKRRSLERDSALQVVLEKVPWH